MNIGTLKFREQAVFLAPMETITEHSFRLLCKQFGADLVCSEFVSSDMLIQNSKKSLAKLKIYDNERPLSIQIYGHIVDSMREAAIIVEQYNPDIIDINFGCPVRKIAKRGAGSGMMRDVPKMVEITDAIVKAVKLPVTVKTRLGWDEDSKNIVEVAERLQDVGIKALTIHARTGKQLYNGEADWTLIGEVKKNPRMNIPLIGNGDITNAEIAKQMFERFGVDAIMIGRAAIEKPWLFKEIRNYLDTGVLLEPLSIKEIVEIARLHFQMSIDYKKGEQGIYEMRRYFSSYFKDLPDFKETRYRLMTTKSHEEIWLILKEIEDHYGKF
jgi:tRNA-dihydrouridine synthase B